MHLAFQSRIWAFAQKNFLQTIFSVLAPQVNKPLDHPFDSATFFYLWPQQKQCHEKGIHRIWIAYFICRASLEPGQGCSCRILKPNSLPSNKGLAVPQKTRPMGLAEAIYFGQTWPYKVNANGIKDPFEIFFAQTTILHIHPAILGIW